MSVNVRGKLCERKTAGVRELDERGGKHGGRERGSDEIGRASCRERV